MVDSSSSFSPVKLSIFSSTFTFALIILVIILADSIMSNLSLHIGHRLHLQLHTHQALTTQLKITSEEIRLLNSIKPQELDLLSTPGLGERFDSRVTAFFGLNNHCETQVFMTWISPSDSFRERQLFALESLFQTNPKACLIILSKTMDSEVGRRILEPLVSLGFRVQAISPDLWALLENTPAENWLDDIRNGKKDPGAIPLAQNLSNLIRLAALYKYGGVYLDTDFIVLKDLSGLRNSIGAQSVGASGNWTRLNNAVLVFEKRHFLLYKFLEEFASSFDGNTWGHNGPYLVSRVVNNLAKTGEYNFTILPPAAFYPVDWTRVAGFFVRPHEPVGVKWVGMKVRQLKRSSYAVHLWNRQSRRLEIEEGSIIGRLISAHRVTCSRNNSSSSR